MKKNKKKYLSFLLAVAMVIGSLTALVGCGSKETSGSGEGDSKLIGVCMQNMTSSISELEATALKETFEAQGYEVQIQDAADSSSTQKSQVDTFILQGVDMLVILPCDIEVLEDSLIEAREDGIKVVISGGTGSISEDAYDAVSSDDEYVIGMWVASITKTWVEESLDADGDWEVAFAGSTISDDAKSRCAGEAQIVEPYLKNEDGDYVNEMWEVVDEADKVENPVYCEAVAKRVEAAGGVSACTTESDISGDNRSVIAGILTDSPKTRVFIGYNSLISTAGSQYVLDTYGEDAVSEYGFFSAGVMGDEYNYLVGSVSDTEGTRSVFRGAAQFGGGDAAATLAALADNVLNGEAGVDYGKTNPNSIGLYYPIAADLNDGVAALVFFDSPSTIRAYTYEEILSGSYTTYWDSKNGFNEDATADDSEEADGAEAGGSTDTYGTPYTYVNNGAMGEETLEIDLSDDGKAYFYLPGNEMLTDVYCGDYTQDGDTVTITGLANIDSSSSYTTPGLWSFIDSESGDCQITIDEAAGTFTPVE
jgi:hypothetical protein